jgi:hypothetical protein
VNSMRELAGLPAEAQEIISSAQQKLTRLLIKNIEAAVDGTQRSYLVPFGDQLLQRPLDVGKAPGNVGILRWVKSTPRLTNHWRISRKQL